MGVLALLGLLALQPELSAYSPRGLCDLAPSYGAGQSSEGHVDETSSLSFSCAYEVLSSGALRFAPQLSWSEQHWTLFRKKGPDASSTLQSFQARDVGLGVLTSYRIAHSDIYLGLRASRGSGQLQRTDSQTASRLTATYSNLDHRSFQQEIGVRSAINEHIAWTLAAVHSQGSHRWDAAQGRFEGENVNPQQQLTLTSGSAADIPETGNRLSYATWDIKVGLSLLFL